MFASIARFFIITLIFLVLTGVSVFPQNIDYTFGPGGAVFSMPPYPPEVPGTTWANGIRGFIRPDGSITILTHADPTWYKSPPYFSMVRANIDATGYPITWGPHHLLKQPLDGALCPDGRVAAIWNANNDMNLGLLEMDGTLGVTATYGAPSDTDEAKNVEVQPDGKILVSGSSVVSGQKRTVVLRYAPNGTLDPTFGPYGNGIVSLFDNGVLSQRMTIKSDGKILLLGRTNDTQPPADETVSMYFQLMPDGSPDPAFGESGLAYVVDYGRVSYDDLKTLPDGKSYTLATRTNYPIGTINTADDEVLLTRLRADGSIDTSFGQAGRVVANTSPPFLPLTYNSDDQ